MTPTLAILERLVEHLRAAVRADDVETRFNQPNRVISCAGSHIEHLACSSFFELIDEKLPLRFGPCAPVDQFVPLLDEPANVFLLVVASLSDLEW